MILVMAFTTDTNGNVYVTGSTERILNGNTSAGADIFVVWLSQEVTLTEKFKSCLQ